MYFRANLDKLRVRHLYCDADSVIFVQKAKELPLIECCDVLGDMSSKLKEKQYISEFVSGGPKNSANEICNSVKGEVKTVCNVRGITLNYQASQLVNFDTIYDLVLNGSSDSTLTVRK